MNNKNTPPLSLDQVKNHAKALKAFQEERCQKEENQLTRLFMLLDYELDYLMGLGQDKMAQIYLSAIYDKGQVFDVNRYPLHGLLIDCVYRARDQGRLSKEISGGFVWQVVVDSLQSHLLDWIISPVDYDVKAKVMGHLRKLLPLLAA